MKLTLKVKVAWWLHLYLAGVRLMSELTGMEPDVAKVEAMVERGVSFAIEGGEE